MDFTFLRMEEQEILTDFLTESVEKMTEDPNIQVWGAVTLTDSKFLRIRTPLVGRNRIEWKYPVYIIHT